MCPHVVRCVPSWGQPSQFISFASANSGLITNCESSVPSSAKQEAQIQIAYKLLQIKFTLDLIKAILISSLADFEKMQL